MQGIEFTFDTTELLQQFSQIPGVIDRAIHLIGLEALGNIKKEAPVDQTRLRGSFQLEEKEKQSIIRSNVDYALAVHEGTGIYGESGQPIRPVIAKVLRFYSKAAGGIVFAKEVKGQKPNPFAERGLDKTGSRVSEFVDRAFREAGLI